MGTFLSLLLMGPPDLGPLAQSLPNFPPLTVSDPHLIIHCLPSQISAMELISYIIYTP